MKKTMYLTTMVFAVLLMTLSAGAQVMGSGGQGMMTESGQQQEKTAPQDFDDEQYMMYPGWGNCYGMGPGMMGGYGMGPGMMGGYGKGYRHGHMMDEYAWGPNRFSSPEAYNKFMDETKELRKKMHDMQFEYGEMMRNPKTTMGDLEKMRQEMYDLRKKIVEKFRQ